MPVDRFFLDDKLSAHTEVILGDQELHHLAHVSRNKVGETVELINGKGTIAIAQVLEIKKNCATLSISSSHAEAPSSFKVILAQAIPRPNRLDMIVEKGTELGMDELWLFPGKLSEKKELKPNQLDRLRKILISATKQSGRLYLPKLSLHPSIAEWQEENISIYFGDLDPEAPPFLDAWHKAPPAEGIIFCIGPESGFHKKETEQLKKLKGKGVMLHQNILRTDTAPLAALSLISQARLTSFGRAIK
jgi:16S rRNA (uracil1498-N3)-methyltransferase